MAPALLIASVLSVTAPQIALANRSNCQDISSLNDHVGMKLLSGTTNRDGLAATITPYLDSNHDGLRPCQDNAYPLDTDKDGSSSAWVAYEGANAGSCTGSNAINCILQVGIIDCDWSGITSVPACEDNIDQGAGTQYVGFYAMGGCNGAVPTPQILHNFGTYAPGSHEFKIASSSGNNWSLSIDYGTPNVHIIYVDRNDPAINCWDSTSTMDYAMDGEMHDRGDSVGGSTSSLATQFTGMESHIEGGNWQFFSFASSTCSYADNNTGCIKGAHSDWMNIWGP